MKIVFIDPKCPAPYDSQVLASRGLGGTEATVVRIARALAEHHDVRVLQHNRVDVLQESPTLHFLPFSHRSTASAGADHVIFIQKAQDLPAIARATRGRLWLWLHNYAKEEVPLFWQDHLRYRLGIICVSRTHAQHTRNYIRSQPLSFITAPWIMRAGVLFQYNPLDTNIRPLPAQAYDPFKLVFFSSPYKGIEHVLAHFHHAYDAEPRLRLFVADPGYIRNFDASQLDHPGIVRLGSLPQAQVVEQVRDALCVFYPQTKRPETFGLVYAEANAVGTPVLAHRFGAAEEILAPSNPPIDAGNRSEVLATLFDWIKGNRPRVGLDARFSLDQVVDSWTRFLSSPETFIASQKLQ